MGSPGAPSNDSPLKQIGGALTNTATDLEHTVTNIDSGRNADGNTHTNFGNSVATNLGNSLTAAESVATGGVSELYGAPGQAQTEKNTNEANATTAANAAADASAAANATKADWLAKVNAQIDAMASVEQNTPGNSNTISAPTSVASKQAQNANALRAVLASNPNSILTSGAKKASTGGTILTTS